MFNVTQINKFYYPVIGGVEKVVYDLTSELSNQVDINVLVCNNRLKLSRDVINGVNVIRAPSVGTFSSMPISPSFPYWLGKFKPDIWHFHVPFPLGDLSYFLRKPKGIVIVTWHSDITKQKKALAVVKPFIINTLEHADKIVTTSPNMIEHSSMLMDYKEKCECIPIGVNEERFKYSVEIEKSAGKIRATYGEKIILFVGRLVYYKGVSYLIEGMRDIDAKLLIIGDGYLKRELVNQCTELGVQEKVVFLETVSDEDMPMYYYACDVFVLPSVENSEAFGLVQVEAMMCEKPVISTNLPTGVPYVNRNNETGLVVDPRNSLQLRDAINLLLKNDKLRLSMGKEAKRRALDMFTTKKMAQQYLELYKRCLAGS